MPRSRFLTALAFTVTTCLTLPSFAKGPSPAVASAQEKEQARAFFQTAMEAHADKRFDDALKGFRDSYDKVASPNTHLMIARTLSSMGRNVEAYQEANDTLAEAKAEAATDEKYNQTVQAAEQELGRLRSSVGLVKVTGTGDADPSATLTVGGRSIDQGRWSEPIVVEPGTMSVELSGRPAKEIRVEAGGETSVDLGATKPHPVFTDPKEEEEEEESSEFVGWMMDNRRIIAYSAGALGAANMILYGVFGGLALKKHDNLEDQCTQDAATGVKRCDPALQDEADTGKTYRTVANVGFGIGVAGLVIGAAFLTWDLVDPKDEAADDEHDDAEGDEIARPRLLIGPGAVSAEWRF